MHEYIVTSKNSRDHNIIEQSKYFCYAAIHFYKVLKISYQYSDSLFGLTFLPNFIEMYQQLLFEGILLFDTTNKSVC